MQSILVYPSGTVANVVCGFDILGFALHAPCDIMRLTLTENGVVQITHHDAYNLPAAPEKNVAGAALLAMLKDLPAQTGFDVEITKNIMPGSGIGSSAASAAGAVVGANKLLDNRFSKKQLVHYAMYGEEVASGSRHADNIAPCIYGGFTLVRSHHPLDIIPLDSPPLFVTVVHPQIEVRTSDARTILKQYVPMRDAITQWGNVAGLVAGLLQKNYALISRSLHDVVVEPVRSMLIPAFSEIKKASLQAGALGGGISGSGPSVFMWSETETQAQKVADAVAEIYTRLQVPHHVYVTTIRTGEMKTAHT